MFDLDASQEDAAYAKLRKSMKVDLSNIDKCIVDHAAIHRDICEWHVFAQKRLSAAIRQAKVAAAAKIQDSKKSMSEEAAKRSWEIDPGYPTAQKAIAAAQARAGMWEGLRESSLEKSHMIRHVVSMITTGNLSTRVSKK